MLLLFAAILLGRRLFQLQLPVRIRLVAHRDTSPDGDACVWVWPRSARVSVPANTARRRREASRRLKRTETRHLGA